MLLVKVPKRISDRIWRQTAIFAELNEVRRMYGEPLLENAMQAVNVPPGELDLSTDIDAMGTTTLTRVTTSCP